MPGIFRNRIKELQNSKNVFVNAIFSFSLLLWSIFKFFIKPRFRSEQLSRIRYPKQIIQVSTFTIKNRYPVLFKQIADDLKDINNPKILSFGCSTGEEVFSLKNLIPGAEIIGVDINRWCLKTASKNNPFPDCQFIHASKEIWKKQEYYDCILALAVFQRTETRKIKGNRRPRLFTFHIFEDEITRLSKCLNMNGLLIIDHSDFKFSDLPIYEHHYIDGSDIPIKRERPVLDKSDNLVNQADPVHRIFKKIN